MRAIRDMIITVMQRLLSVLPIRKDLIIFESNSDFLDSSWLVYEELKEKHYNLVWFVHDFPKALAAHSKNKCNPVDFNGGNFLRYLCGLIIQSRAGVAFYAHKIIRGHFKSAQKKVFVTHASTPVMNRPGCFWLYYFNTKTVWKKLQINTKRKAIWM